MRRQLHLHEAGFPRDKFLTSYFMDSQDIISILPDILFYIWYLTICFWIDWVHVYKYMKIKGLDSREITSLPESKKSDEHGMSFRSSLKWNNESLQQPTSYPHHLPHWSKFCSLRFFFFSTTCSKVISTFKQ